MINYLTNPLISGIISGILSILFYKLDSKITNTKKSKLEYLKIFIISSIVTGLIVYILSIDNTPKLSGVIKKNISSDLPNF